MILLSLPPDIEKSEGQEVLPRAYTTEYDGLREPSEMKRSKEQETFRQLINYLQTCHTFQAKHPLLCVELCYL